MSREDHVGVEELFQWLRACVAMAETGSLFFGDLSAAITARSLSASVCNLLSSGSGASDSIMKNDLRTLRDKTFQWPTEEDVRTENLPPLPKNIAKNIAETFFCDKGRGLVAREGKRLRP